MTQLTAPDAEFIAFQEAVAGKYSLERELGRGGMGIVYLARELRLARPVAIKVLPRMLAAARPELREKFLLEAQMAAQLSHPNIVPIHHVDEIGEFVFFVMTYIEGETLGERVRVRGALPTAEVARMLREIGWALAYAHLRGIVHRDVKPDNILIEKGSGRALVTDFGIAGAARDDDAADASYVRGTAHFLSPEQAMGEATDGRSDIYSLGVVGYYALTGQLPFDGATTVQVMAAHISKRPRALRSFSGHVPHKLAAAVERCLEKERDRRWASGEKLAEAVDAAFEAPREIPAPIRVWLAKGEANQASSTVLLGLMVFGPVAATAYVHPIVAVLAAIPLGLSVYVLPEVLLVRPLIKFGFGLQDLRTALQVHTLRRREEIEYDHARTPIGRRTLRITAIVSLGISLVTGLLLMSGLKTGFENSIAETVLALVGGVAGTLGVASALGALGVTLTGRYESNFGERRLKFWHGKWGGRIMRLASFGLGRRTAATPMLAQHTEVALSRATDALFQALPKALRRELKEVPLAVQRLESEASVLRRSLDSMDELLTGTDDARVRDKRDAAADRLASTVTALENIRLGLLRLQLGVAPVAQITEALEAATRIGREIDFRLEAEDEIGDVLKPKRIANRDPEPSPV